MSALHKALRDVCADLERFDANAPSLHFARGVLAGNGQRASKPFRGKDAKQFPEMVAAYQSGDSLNYSAELLGMSPSGFGNLLRRHGHKVRPSKRRGHSQQTLDRSACAAELYGQGKTVREIAAAIGLPKPEMAYRFLAIAGVRPSRHRKHVEQPA